MTGRQDGRLHSAVLVSPGRERRRDRKSRKAAAHALLVEDRETRRAAEKAKSDALAAERRPSPAHTAIGKPGRTCVIPPRVGR